MMEDEEYKKLAVDERCVHKLWKARVSAYEELVKLFRQLDDEKSPEFGKYLGLVKKFVTDSNAMGQEKGLEATLAYVENYAHAGKTVSEVMSGIVLKCLAAPKTKTRELALQVSLMYVEIEKFEAVQEELLKGTEQKNPKIVAACIQTLTTALREFGIKVIGPKPMIKRIGVLFSDRDKAVRDEARAMVIEMYKWMGQGLKNHLAQANLQPVQMAELVAEFSKVDGQKACPTRYIRSQQQKQAKMAAQAEDINDGEEEETPDDGPEDVDPYELASPVDVLSKLPKDFYEKVEAKKWQERKESLDAVENLLKSPKLESGDYGDLVRALKKVVQKDSNVMCVALAGKCIAGLANGLKKRFQTYSGCLVLPLLEKFKEKKQNVVTAIREAIDATYLSTSLEAILDDVLEALGNKNPTVKSEVALFLARAFTKTQPMAVNKKLLKSVTSALTKNINESDPGVRESSAEALGTLMKLVGEKAIGPFLVELEKDKLKMDKIKEFCEKAEITVKVAVAKKAKSQPSSAATQEPTTSKAVKNVTSGKAGQVKKKPVASNVSSGSATVVRSKGAKGVSAKPVLRVEKELEDGEVESIVADVLAENVILELSNSTWKTRLNAVEEILTKIQSMENKSVPSQAFVKTLMKKPGLKDTNFQVLRKKLEIIKCLAENSPFSTTTVDCCVADISEKFGDAKNGAIVAETLTAMAEATSLGHVSATMLSAIFAQKSPKIQQEGLAWLTTALKEFGIAGVDVKALIDYCKIAIGSANPGVRQSAIQLLGTMYLFMGANLHMFFENEKAALRDQIHAEFDKYEGVTVPAPIRGAKGAETIKPNKTEKMGPGSKSNGITAFEEDEEEERTDLPEKPLLKKAQAPEKKAAKGGTSGTTKQNAAKSKGSSSPAKRNGSPTGRKKDDDTDPSPLLVVNNLKHQRTIDESKLKVLKWNFTQPREEFIDLLKDQMSAANVNKTLMSNMFHADFRFHIKAIKSLMEDLPDHGEALIANLDLILKWLTLRFFDTNPSVLLKGLEYLHSIFNMLSENQYRMLENEGSSFVPYLVLKIGDPKDTVRNGVKSLLKQITAVFPVSRLSVYVMEGVKSKNARQRAECLEVMGSMIERYGVTVCQPSPAICLKEVAKQISDRDNSVRNAALNCVVQVFNIVGDKVYKMVGNISDKDLSLLEERIKRTSRKTLVLKSEINPSVPEVSLPTKKVLTGNETIVVKRDEYQDAEEEPLPVPVPTLPSAVPLEQPKKEIQGPFKLESEIMNDLDKITPYYQRIPTVPVDYGFLSEELKMPSFFDNKVKIMPLSPPKPVTTRVGHSPHMPACDPDLSRAIKLIGSQNLGLGLQGLEQCLEYMNSPLKVQAFPEHENDFFEALISLLRHLRSLDPLTNPTAVKIYRNVFRNVDAFCSKPQLGENLRVESVKQIINELLTLLVEQKLDTFGDSYVKVINSNCVKIIELSGHTIVICALIQLMTEKISGENCVGRHVDLVMKCLWKVIRLMPTWGEAVDYEIVLLDVHNFLVKFPPSWWSLRPMDTPLKTIKTILHSVVKCKGASSMQLLRKIPNPAESDIESYMQRVLKTFKIAQAQEVSVPSQKNSLSRANHNMLTEIFQKIGNKEHTKDGLNLLYDFIQQHPEADIEPFLSKSSKFFQEYIQTGLKEIDGIRRLAKRSNTDVIGGNNSDEEIDPEKNPDYFEERLKTWRFIWDELMAGRAVDHSLWPLDPNKL